jgi:hypothetical protein
VNDGPDVDRGEFALGDERAAPTRRNAQMEGL